MPLDLWGRGATSGSVTLVVSPVLPYPPTPPVSGQSEGCDGVLGSGLVRDRCGVCGGRDASCRRVSATFNDTSVPLGYHHILDIPVGATAINITERKASPNYLGETPSSA